jgi:hypothetical protein
MGNRLARIDENLAKVKRLKLCLALYKTGESVSEVCCFLSEILLLQEIKGQCIVCQDGV